MTIPIFISAMQCISNSEINLMALERLLLMNCFIFRRLHRFSSIALERGVVADTYLLGR